MYKILEKINSNKALKKLSIDQLNEFAIDVRNALMNRMSKFGGHFGSNFGMVECEIALHYVFDSPYDKFIFDVSHQAYTHKIITGRKDGYLKDECFKEESGYTNPNESEHDLFNVGHTSTSIGLALGLAKARDINSEKNNVIAIIGDGSLSGGEALEALSVAGSELNSNLIIIVNDNEQSISETHGGIYKNLKMLRETNGKYENNIFKSFGLDYIYEEKGNDILSLINVLNKIKNIDHPIVLHIHTLKGKGYDYAIKEKEKWHLVPPFNVNTGEFLNVNNCLTYTQIAKNCILQKAKEDKSVLIITPNMPKSLLMNKSERDALGNQFVDVGIAEELAVCFASGASKGNTSPLVFTNMTFMQRTYDQVSHDVCLNNSSVTFLINFSSFYTMKDKTHLGIFSLPIFSNIPNLTVLLPSSKEELEYMISFSLKNKNGPIMILIPGNNVYSRKILNRNIFEYEIAHLGNKIALLGLGDFYQKAEEIHTILLRKYNIDATLINPRNASNLDYKVLELLKENHKLIVTLEDGIIDGGFGPKIASFYALENIKVKSYGLKKEFIDRYNPDELLLELHMDNNSIIEDILNIINK